MTVSVRLQAYLLSCGVTLITVSHDSGFLDTVCTGIIHYESKKLVRYRGNLSEFVKQKPEAAAYYELTNEFQQFTFPLPGPLDGVKCALSLSPSLSLSLCLRALRVLVCSATVASTTCAACISDTVHVPLDCAVLQGFNTF